MEVPRRDRLKALRTAMWQPLEATQTALQPLSVQQKVPTPKKRAMQVCLQAPSATPVSGVPLPSAIHARRHDWNEACVEGACFASNKIG